MATLDGRNEIVPTDAYGAIRALVLSMTKSAESDIHFEITMVIDATRKDRQEWLEWIHSRSALAGRPVLPAGPLSVTMRFEYPPLKGMTKRRQAAMKAGQDVYRTTHPTVTQLADLLFEALIPHTPARVSRLMVEKVFSETPRVVMIEGKRV